MGCPTEGLHLIEPVADDRSSRCTGPTAPATTGQPWLRRPYSILFPTGYTAEVLEVPPRLGSAAVSALARRRHAGPVAALPDGGLLLFTGVTSGHATIAGLLAEGVLHHGRGSWVPLPPSELADGPVCWQVAPHDVRWQLPTIQSVADVLRHAIATAATSARTPAPARRLVARMGGARLTARPN